MRFTAWLCAILHVAASLALLLLLRKGLPPNTIEARVAYITTHPLAWRWSWITWHAAGISFVLLCIVLAMRLKSPLAFAGAATALVAVYFDIHSEQGYMHVLPKLIGESFREFDRWLDVENAGVANFFYTLALVILMYAGRHVLPRLAITLTWPVAIAGFAMTAFAVMHVGIGEIISSALLFPFFVAWCIVLARWSPQNESSSPEAAASSESSS
ncbi:MAG TPA: hypothetical protein VMU84_20765 [Thermoanaerobaculia bacterium]|nr:hypothetical protein [Thermoanaerobaculia bacterium]